MNSHNSIEYSVVVPVFNSLETLEPLYLGIEDFMTRNKYSFEVIFVEDSSLRDSWSELLKIKKISPDNVRIIKLSRNFGQNGATLCGIDSAKGRRVVTIDDDLQIAPKEIEHLIKHMNASGADVVYGKSNNEKTSKFRKWASRWIKNLFERSQGNKSIGTSFRLIEHHIVDRIKFHSQDHLFINQVISWYTESFEFVEVEHKSRSEGKSGYSWPKLIGLSFKLIFYYTSIPLLMMVFFCLIGALVLLGMIVYYFYYQIEAGKTVDLFMISVLLSMALISLGMSVFGMYINRIYSSRVKKPNYSIKVKL